MRRCPSGWTSVITGETEQGWTRARGHGAWMEVMSRGKLGVSRERQDGVHRRNGCGAGMCWGGRGAAERPPMWPARCSWTQRATPSESEPRPRQVLGEEGFSPSYLPWKGPSQL